MPRNTRPATALSQFSPEVQKLLALPGNEAAREAVAKRSSLATQAGVDADVVEARERRSRGARRASKHGGRTELLVIGAYHEAALRRGVAYMEKIATPHRRIGPAPVGATPGAFVAVYAKNPSVDCFGYTLRGTPRAIAEEVKGVSVTRKSGDFAPFNMGRLEGHQREALDRAHASGHIAIVTLVFGDGVSARVYVIPWSWMSDRTSVHEAEARDAGFRVTPETYLVAEVRRAQRARGAA